MKNLKLQCFSRIKGLYKIKNDFFPVVTLIGLRCIFCEKCLCFTTYILVLFIQKSICLGVATHHFTHQKMYRLTDLITHFNERVSSLENNIGASSLYATCK